MSGSSATPSPWEDVFCSSSSGTDVGKDDDPICIVGMACRLPGGITSPSGLWEFLMSKRSAQGPVPKERFNVAGFYSPDGSRDGVMDVAGGYFLQEDVRHFENSFFGINNLEATYIDPQQRKLLEVVFECFEDAGVPLERISGTNTGVYVGNFTIDFQGIQTRDPDFIHRYTATGCGTTILANRISHVFNLQGPSFTLDTACSSSIYCLHTAVTAIRAGDCDGAIVAGVNLIMAPEQCLGTMKAGVLSPDSACHTFDASANGYGRAEAVNAVYLKRLSSAFADGDQICAVIRGTAVNANGRTPGITQPSANLQEALIRKAYASAKLDFSETDYVECHGTGTSIGDPIEVDAVGRCFSRSLGSPLMIGSVKSSLGHSEGASGLTSLIKVILALQNSKIPPTYGVKELNPKLRLDLLNMKVVTEVEDWPRALRRASINSFGYGGANAHVILESVNSYFGRDAEPIETVAAQRDQLLAVPVSAASRNSLEARVEQVQTAIHLGGAETLMGLAYTLAERRSHLPVRQVLMATARADGKAELLNAELMPHQTSPDPIPVGFVFTGQGAQYANMGKELLDKDIRFLATIRRLDDILRTIPPNQAPSWTLEQTILDPPETSQIHNAARSQPVCTAIQIGLVDLLRAWGVRPSGVVGHSSGEIAAAYAAGLLSARQAILVAYFRGYAVGQLKTQGSMLAAGLDVDAANHLIQEKRLQGQVCIACVNACDSVTLSGSVDGIEMLLTTIQEQSKFARKLQTGGRAYHSHMMKEIGPLYEELLEPYFGDRNERLRASKIRMYSSVGLFSDESTSTIPDDYIRSAKYWRNNLERSVQFQAALESLTEGTKRLHLIEIGPHPALKGAVQKIRSYMKRGENQLPYACTLVRKEDAHLSMMKLAGALFLHNCNLLWQNVNTISGSNVQPLRHLPPYPWDYSGGLLWHEPRTSIEQRNRQYTRHELLGSQQVAGNGICWRWRNVLRLDEIPWMRDHKLEAQIVFPATAYLAVAIKALSQIRPLGPESTSWFEFRNVSISAALVVPESNDDKSDVELHTSMSPRELSTTSTSDDWYDFSISSWLAGQATLHCAGSLRIADNDSMKLVKTVVIQDTDCFDEWSSMSPWYKRFEQQGLFFGPNFQSVSRLRTDGHRTRWEAVCTTRLNPPASEDASHTHYPLHPITMDACLQAAIMSTTAGDISALRAYLPVFIDECRIRSSPPGKLGKEPAMVHVRSTRTGFSTQQVNCTLWDSHGAPLIHLQNVRMSEYTARITREPPLPRQPCLRVHWKPDIQRLHQGAEEQLGEYMRSFINERQNSDLADDERLAMIGVLVDLVGHQNPRMRVLELGETCGCKAKQWLKLLDQGTGFQRCQSWHTARVDEKGDILRDDDSEGAFDLILIPGRLASQEYWEKIPDSITSLATQQGIIITRKTTRAVAALRQAHFSIMELEKQLLLAIRPFKNGTLPLNCRKVIIVVREPSAAATAFADALKVYLQQEMGASDVKKLSLGDINPEKLHKEVVCISLLEIDREFLASMNQRDIDLLRGITNVVTTLLWLTGADMLGKNLDSRLTLSSGLSRALMLEQPSLRFAVMDVGPLGLPDSSPASTFENIIRALQCSSGISDNEFIQKDRLLYISRFVPDFEVNSLFRRRLDAKEQVRMVTLAAARPAQLSIGKVGVSDTIYFQQLRQSLMGSIPDGFVDILVKAVSLNAKDVYVVNGRVETHMATSALEFSGIVIAVGSGVTHLQPGDPVVVLAPNHFSTTERVPAWAAHKMLPGEQFTVMPTLPLAYVTALYALRECARLRSGESILIHAGSGGVGMAAIAIAQRTGAIVYATAGSPAKRRFVAAELGVPEAHVFHSRDASFVAGIMAATGGHGVDVVINSLVGDLMHASWDCLASFGRFIEVGKRELVDAGKLNMRVFLRNASFSAFDITDLFFAQDQYRRDLFSSLTSEALELYRTKSIKPAPVTIFSIADVAQAYRYFSAKDRVGKVVISLENDDARIPVIPSRYLTVFHPEKVYLLVGCLGGLGRSLSRWMVACGARNLVFLGRSGCDKQSARDHVSLLKKAKVNVTVVRGDVVEPSRVAAAMSACRSTGKPVGGVVQAAMGLHEALFSRITSDAWHTAIQPKWAGTWNLHKALEGHDQDLDFFLLTSSVSGSVGTATESNYCAANGFLDAFARWRRAQGKPAVSVGLGMISEVGYLHENPEIEALLLRRGIQPLNEAEFLQVIDLALSGAQDPANASHGDLSSAHLLTGLEPFGVYSLMEQGFDVSHGTMQDPRSSVLSAALAATHDLGRQEQRGTTETGHLATSAWLKGLPMHTAGSLISEADAPSLQDAILRLTRKRLSNLILTPPDQIDHDRPLAKFGVDSMIASEFRTWFWTTFKVDVPFLDLLSHEKTLNTLAEFVEEKLADGEDK